MGVFEGMGARWHRPWNRERDERGTFCQVLRVIHPRRLLQTVLLAAAIALGGCATPVSDVGQAPEETSATHVTEREFDLLLSQARLPGGSHTSNSDNCVGFDGSTTLVEGALELAWAPTTEVARVLTLEAARGIDVIATVKGPSPLLLEFGKEEASVGSPERRYTLEVILDEPGIIVDQPATLKVMIRTEGAGNITLETGSCSAG